MKKGMEDEGGRRGNLINYKSVTWVIRGMIPKTPKKKKSMEIEYSDFINNSCNGSHKLVISGNNSNFQSYLQKSIFKSRPEDPIFKNSQAIISKKPTNGILGKKYAQPDNIFKSRQP